MLSVSLKKKNKYKVDKRNIAKNSYLVVFFRITTSLKFE